MTTSDPSLRDLLSRVASGDLDPSEAARLLDEDATTPTVDQREVGDLTTTSSVTSVQLLAGGVNLIVIADPGVASAVADGSHSVRHDGSRLLIEAPGGDGYQVRDKPKYLGWVPSVWTGGRGERVTVRVNPDLPLGIEATACKVDLSGLHADLTLKVQASSVSVREHRGALHGSAVGSSVGIVGAITEASSLVCEFGSLEVRLTAGSDVTVNAVSEMGSLKLGDGKATTEDNGLRSRGSTGHGAHVFDLLVRMGSASVVAS